MQSVFRVWPCLLCVYDKAVVRWSKPLCFSVLNMFTSLHRSGVLLGFICNCFGFFNAAI